MVSPQQSYPFHHAKLQILHLLLSDMIRFCSIVLVYIHVHGPVIVNLIPCYCMYMYSVLVL